MGYTTDPLLSDVLIARKINEALGGPFLSPWEVKQMPDSEIDVLLEIAKGRPKMVEGMAKVEAHFADFRKRYGYKST